MEKKREVNERMRSFRERSPGGGGAGGEEVRDGDLMGGEDGEGGVDAFKTQKKEWERKKNERELRKEEVLRVSSSFLLSVFSCDCL